MIIDSHTYCFQPGTHPAGFSTPAEHLAWIQTAQGLHHQPAWRVNDRTPASSAGLGEGNPKDSSNLPDVDFRIDDEAWAATMYEQFLKTFLEDVDILEAQQRSLDGDPDAR